MSNSISLPVIVITVYAIILLILLAIGKLCFKWKMAFYMYMLIAAVLEALLIVIMLTIAFDSSQPSAAPGCKVGMWIL